MGQTPSVAFLRKYAESNKDLLVSHALRERNRSVMSTYQTGANMTRIFQGGRNSSVRLLTDGSMIRNASQKGGES